MKTEHLEAVSAHPAPLVSTRHQRRWCTAAARLTPYSGRGGYQSLSVVLGDASVDPLRPRLASAIQEVTRPYWRSEDKRCRRLYSCSELERRGAVAS